jgi:hypothetical protein
VYEVNTQEGGECKLASQASSFFKNLKQKVNQFENSTILHAVMNEEINNLNN